MMPYLAGTKNVLCMPIMNTAETTSAAPMTASVCGLAQPQAAACGRRKPHSARLVMPISAYFQKTIVVRLLNLSASTPASGEKKKNGEMKQAVTIVTIAFSSIHREPTNRTSMSPA